MRRRAGDLLPLEAAILHIAKDRAEPFHGWSIGPSLEEATGQDVPFGTRYRTLDRLELLGYLASDWGQPEKPGLPPRRLYRITPEGLQALATARRTPVGSKPSRAASPQSPEFVAPASGALGLALLVPSGFDAAFSHVWLLVVTLAMLFGGKAVDLTCTAILRAIVVRLAIDISVLWVDLWSRRLEPDRGLTRRQDIRGDLAWRYRRGRRKGYADFQLALYLARPVFGDARCDVAEAVLSLARRASRPLVASRFAQGLRALLDRAAVPDASARVELKGAAIGTAALRASVSLAANGTETLPVGLAGAQQTLDVAAFQVIQAHRQRSWETFFAATSRSMRGRVIGPPPFITTTGDLPYYGANPSGPARYA